MQTLLWQAIDVYRGLGRDGAGLAKVSAIWFGLHVLASYLLAPVATHPYADMGVLFELLVSLGFTLLMVANYYAVHIFLLEPDAPPRWLPPLKGMSRYVGVMFSVTIFAWMGGLIFSIPFHLAWDVVMQIKGIGGEIITPALPFYFELLPSIFMALLFSRYLLTAPLLLRGADHPFHASIRYLRGHVIRLTVLGFILVLPFLLPIVLWMRVGRYELSDGPLLLLSLFYSLANLVMVWLEVRLMENEYARRVK